VAYIGVTMRGETKERVAPAGQADLSPENRALVDKFREQIQGVQGYRQATWIVEEIGSHTVAVTMESELNELNPNDVGRLDNVRSVIPFTRNCLEVFLNPDPGSYLAPLQHTQSQADGLLFKGNKLPGNTGTHGGAMGSAGNNSRAETRVDDASEILRRLRLQKRLDGLQERFENRLREIEIPATGFTTKEQAADAARLSTNFADIQKVEAELGYPPTPKPERVREAERLRMEFVRHHNKEGEAVPVRPRGRPRRELMSSAITRA
jgi:hypothetical protein